MVRGKPIGNRLGKALQRRRRASLREMGRGLCGGFLKHSAWRAWRATRSGYTERPLRGAAVIVPQACPRLLKVEVVGDHLSLPPAQGTDETGRYVSYRHNVGV